MNRVLRKCSSFITDATLNFLHGLTPLAMILLYCLLERKDDPFNKTFDVAIVTNTIVYSKCPYHRILTVPSRAMVQIINAIKTANVRCQSLLRFVVAHRVSSILQVSGTIVLVITGGNPLLSKNSLLWTSGKYMAIQCSLGFCQGSVFTTR